MMTPKKTKKNFESQMKELEQLVGELESGSLALDLSLDKFERGVKLYKECREMLNCAEKKVKILTEGLEEEEFNID